MQPAFSIIITVFNKEKHIKNTLKSVLNQTYKNYEVIIVDDGSTDNSLELINSFEIPNKLVIKQNNKGVSHARNKGIEKANYNYIALLDGDDYWKKTYLEEFVKAINLYPNQHIYSCAIAHHYFGRIVPVNYNFIDSSELSLKSYFENSLSHTLLSSSSTVFKKNILKKTGVFDTSIKSGQDTDFWIRIGLHFSIVFINKVLAYYVYDTKSLSNTTFNLNDKPKLDNYLEYESKNKALKTFLDKNRFSLAVMSKLYEDENHFNFYVNQIDFKNLNWKQKLILKSPRQLINILLKIKSIKGNKLYYKPL